MKHTFSIQVAHLHISISCKYDYIKSECCCYLCKSSVDDISINITEYEKSRERLDKPVCNDCILENITGMRLVAEVALHHQRMLIHGACIDYKGKGYLFTAPSGTGKTTHISLWKKMFGEKVTIINGDKPMINFSDPDHITIHGTPWMGKEHWGCNTFAPLSGIILLRRSNGKGNAIRRVSSFKALQFLYGQIYLIEKEEYASLILQGIDTILHQVPVWELYCDMTEDAVNCVYEALN